MRSLINAITNFVVNGRLDRTNVAGIGSLRGGDLQLCPRFYAACAQPACMRGYRGMLIAALPTLGCAQMTHLLTAPDNRPRRSADLQHLAGAAAVGDQVGDQAILLTEDRFHDLGLGRTA